MTLLRYTACAVLSALAACNTANKTATPAPVPTSTTAEEVVAMVGPYPVAIADLEQAVAAIFGADTRPEGLREADRKIALDALIGARLLVLEAEHQGIDRDPAIIATLDSLQAVRLREAIYQHDVYRDLPAASAEDLAELYAEWGSGEQIRAAHILVRSQQEAADILRLLAQTPEQMSEFGTLAKERSQHTGSSLQGGDMGYLRRGQYPADIADAIWDLPVRQYTHEPVHTSMGWHVVLVTDRRRLTLEDQQGALEAEFDRRQRQSATTRFTAELRDSYEVSYHPETAVAIASLHDTLSGERRLFSWKGGALDLKGFLRRVQVPDPVSEDTARMHRLAAELVFDELAAREAEARGHQNRDEVRIPVRDKRFKLLGERMFAAEMATEPSLDEVRGFFDDHREQFRSHTVVTVREILVDSPADADSLHQLVEAGGALEELARQHTVRSDLRLTGGLWEDVRPKDPRSDRIYQAALRQGPGLHPPLKVPGGHSVFEVLEIRPGEMLTFEEAAGSARKSLASFRMEALIARLRQEYSEHISVDPGAHGRPALDTR